MTDKTGGRAFPFAFETASPDDPGIHGGMTLRDYFAAKAIQSILRDEYFSEKSVVMGYAEFADEAAEEAYEMADAMLKASAAVKEKP